MLHVDYVELLMHNTPHATATAARGVCDGVHICIKKVLCDLITYFLLFVMYHWNISGEL